MNMKRRLILEQPAMICVGNATAQPEILEAEAVLLRVVIEWPGPTMITDSHKFANKVLWTLSASQVVDHND